MCVCVWLIVKHDRKQRLPAKVLDQYSYVFHATPADLKIF